MMILLLHIFRCCTSQWVFVCLQSQKLTNKQIFDTFISFFLNSFLKMTILESYLFSPVSSFHHTDFYSLSGEIMYILKLLLFNCITIPRNFTSAIFYHLIKYNFFLYCYSHIYYTYDLSKIL